MKIKFPKFKFAYQFIADEFGNRGYEHSDIDAERKKTAGWIDFITKEFLDGIECDFSAMASGEFKPTKKDFASYAKEIRLIREEMEKKSKELRRSV